MSRPPMDGATGSVEDEVHRRVGGFLNLKLYAAISRVVDPAAGPPEMEVIKEHMEWALALEAEGAIFAAGPFVTEDGAMQGDGLLVVRAENAAAATEMLAADPLHSSGYRTFEVQGWMLHQGRVDVAVTYSDRSCEVV